MEMEFIMIKELIFNNSILASGSEWIWVCIVAEPPKTPPKNNPFCDIFCEFQKKITVNLF